MPTTPGKYFTELQFTIDIPPHRPLDKEMLEMLAEQLHRPDPNLTLDPMDAISILDIKEGD